MKKILSTILIAGSLYHGVRPAVHTVTNTNDSGAGSLRQALLDANSDAGPSRLIMFSIGSGVQTIKPLSDLPSINVNNVLLTGTTQPGWGIDNPQIVIDGSLWPSPAVATGLITIHASSYCVIQGLVINNASKTRQNGILITDDSVVGANSNAVYGCFIGTDQTGTVAAPNVNGIRINAFTTDFTVGNTIGGPLSGQRNVISGNNNAGLELLKNVNNTLIQGNYIGTDKTGTVSLPNKGFGIGIFGSLTPLPTEHCVGTIIGGSSDEERNVISGNVSGDPNNPSIGIVFLLNCVDTIIKGNYIGVDVTGVRPLANDLGILLIGAYEGNPGPDGAIDGTIIGGSAAGEGNVISANNQNGIYFQYNVINSTIQGNYIGTDETATSTVLGNGSSGIIIQGQENAPCVNNLIGGKAANEGNIIVHNGSLNPNDKFGVFIDGNSLTPDILNPILGNSIFNNVGDGIELQNNGNHLQESPTIVNAKFSVVGNLILVTATAPSTPSNSNFRLEFFVNDINRNPITEGQSFIGAIPSVPSGATITQAFSVPSLSIMPNSWVSATATNLNNTNETPGDTSEFSTNVQMSSLTSIMGCC